MQKRTRPIQTPNGALMAILTLWAIIVFGGGALLLRPLIQIFSA